MAGWVFDALAVAAWWDPQLPLIQGSLWAPKLVFSYSSSQCCSWALPHPLLRSRLRAEVCVLPASLLLRELRAACEVVPGSPDDRNLSQQQAVRAGDTPVLGVLEAAAEKVVWRQESGG